MRICDEHIAARAASSVGSCGRICGAGRPSHLTQDNTGELKTLGSAPAAARFDFLFNNSVAEKSLTPPI